MYFSTVKIKCYGQKQFKERSFFGRVYNGSGGMAAPVRDKKLAGCLVSVRRKQKEQTGNRVGL